MSAKWRPFWLGLMLNLLHMKHNDYTSSKLRVKIQLFAMFLLWFKEIPVAAWSLHNVLRINTVWVHGAWDRSSVDNPEILRRSGKEANCYHLFFKLRNNIFLIIKGGANDEYVNSVRLSL